MINIESKCSWCRVGNKDAVHVLFECIFANMVWESTGLTNCVQVMPNETVVGIFKRLFNSEPNEQCVLIALLCWS